MSAFLLSWNNGKKLNEDYISKENGWKRKGEMKLTCSILGFENVYNLDGGILNWHYEVIKGIPEERKHIKALLLQIEEPKGGVERWLWMPEHRLPLEVHILMVHTASGLRVYPLMPAGPDL